MVMLRLCRRIASINAPSPFDDHVDGFNTPIILERVVVSIKDNASLGTRP